VLLVDRDFTVYVLAAPLSRPGQVAFRLVRIGQGAGYLACEEILIATDLSAIPTTLGEHSTHAVGGAT
jgi:hypothetical protein